MPARSASGADPLRSFAPHRLGRLERDAWVGYYRHEWARALQCFVGMVREGFGMSWPRTMQGAYLVLRANQLWAPYPDNDAALLVEGLTDLVQSYASPRAAVQR